MNSSAPTSQENLWRGNFGDDYVDRNLMSAENLSSLTQLWASVLRPTMGRPPQSILEVGANIGRNLRAIRRLSQAEFSALEPNSVAREQLTSEGIVPASNVFDGLASKIPLGDGAVDLAFTSGVLIHVHPSNLVASCREIYRVSQRYIVCIEYFSDKEEMIPYRGQNDALFKRDFGGCYLDLFPDLRVLDYGFAWKRLTGLDNLTWWIFEKSGS